MAIGAPSHTHWLSFTRKLQPMSKNSPRTYLNEAVMAASGPGGSGGREERGSGGRRRLRFCRLSSAPRRRLTLPGPTATSSSSPRVVLMVPSTQFTLSVADVPVVQSLPLVQCWSSCSSPTVVDVPVVLVWLSTHWWHAGVGVWRGQEAVCSFLQAGG